MTRQQAKKIALAACLPFREHRFNPVLHAAMQMQAEYAAQTEQLIMGTLREIMLQTPGAVVTRVHDTFIIETVSDPQPRQVAIDIRVTQHGVVIEPPKSLPLVFPC